MSIQKKSLFLHLKYKTKAKVRHFFEIDKKTSRKKRNEEDCITIITEAVEFLLIMFIGQENDGKTWSFGVVTYGRDGRFFVLWDTVEFGIEKQHRYNLFFNHCHLIKNQ